ncbi:hypothetical protein [Chryseobacterium taihuense]|uniref:Peptidase C39-like domain-containing protein n=1 Tax=Chryseobacterium taihuense TaxID=1141221 RepID=A0ABY0QSH6_9FLAO|nr:hypothetical protein [Chryseobacterium taihuense]SDL73537.1 hypothetical protein SAMN05216273_105140 [Chryseobacterium taihuense]
MKFFVCLILVTLVGCNKSKVASKDHYSIENSEIQKISYKDFLVSINKKRKEEKSGYLFNFINNDVPNYWTSTPWSFNGTSREPQKGTIACGYFVTNILTDFGFKIDRVYLAQQPSSVMIKKLCTEIKYFNRREDLDQYILSRNTNQIYIVGLDFHTGFITRQIKDTYFIHSNYIQNQGVIKELTKDSKALNASKTFMIGTLNFQ